MSTVHRPSMAAEFRCHVPYDVHVTSDITDRRYDALIVPLSDLNDLPRELSALSSSIGNYIEHDPTALKVGHVSVVVDSSSVSPSGRLILCGVGPVTRDYDDVRRFSEATELGIKRALEMGLRKLLLLCLQHRLYPTSDLVTLLGALQALYVPIEVKEASSDKASKCDLLGIWTANSGAPTKEMVDLAIAIEAGRAVARDIAQSDPERMSPPNVCEYMQSVFGDSASVHMKIISDQRTIKEQYPLMAAVSRAANVVPRHQARVVKLQYTGAGEPKDTLMLVGKGVTLDTGGLDIKTGGNMWGMSRDKSGAAAVAGFFKVLEVLKPPHIKAIGVMALVRSSVGPESYSCDEILTARSGKRIRIVNTDAEGRTIMLDPLCELTEQAIHENNPHLFTIATLTGHAVLTVGLGYSIAVNNGPAEREGEGQKLKFAASYIGDMVELSSLRREDYDASQGKSVYEDLLQSNNAPSVKTERGHTIPVAFLIMGSGLDKHGNDSEYPLKYTHIDMAGTEGPPFPSVPWGSPVAALAARYLAKKDWNATRM